MYDAHCFLGAVAVAGFVCLLLILQQLPARLVKQHSLGLIFNCYSWPFCRTMPRPLVLFMLHCCSVLHCTQAVSVNSARQAGPATQRERCCGCCCVGCRQGGWCCGQHCSGGGKTAADRTHTQATRQGEGPGGVVRGLRRVNVGTACVCMCCRWCWEGLRKCICKHCPTALYPAGLVQLLSNPDPDQN